MLPVPAEDDDPVDSCWPDLLARNGVPPTSLEPVQPAVSVVAVMNSVRTMCRSIAEQVDPPPQVIVALSLVRQAAFVAAQIGTADEPERVAERISAARLALLGQGGTRLRMSDRWAMILTILRDAADRLHGANEVQRRAVAEAVADRMIGVAGCDGPPATELVLRAIDVAHSPRSQRGPVLVELVTAVGLRPTSRDGGDPDPESLERSIRNAIAHVRPAGDLDE